MVAPDGRARILDFGLALVIGGDNRRVTDPGFAVGTPTYMAPEQCAGEPIDARADLYSLGVIFYQMIAGILPFDETGEVARSSLIQAPPRVSARVAGLTVNPAIDDLLQAMLTSRPADRIESASVLLPAIDRILERGELLMWTGRRSIEGAMSEWADIPTARIAPPRMHSP